MHRGYFKCWRKMIESDLWDKSPLHLKVWTWILASVDYKTGELTCTMDHIADRVQWSDKGHPHIPSRKVIHDILHWMKLNSMLSITTLGEGNRKYTKLSVISWHVYQQEKTIDGNRTETEKLPSLRSSKHSEEKEVTTTSAPSGRNGTHKQDAYMDRLVEIWTTLDIPGKPPYSLFGRWRKTYGDEFVLKELNALYLKRENLDGKGEAYIGTLLKNRHAEHLEANKPRPIMPARSW